MSPHPSPLPKLGEGILLIVCLALLGLSVYSLRGEPTHLCKDMVRAPICEVSK